MKTKKAFTLIELLIVIAIIGVLATVVVMALAQSAKEKARIAQGQQFADSVRAQIEEGVYGNNVAGSYWRFNTITGGTTPDEWGDNTGTIVNASLNSGGGIKGGSLIFNGTNSYVGTHTKLGSVVTVSLWAKTSVTSFSDMLWVIDGDQVIAERGPDLWFRSDTEMIYLNTWNGAGNPICNLPSKMDEWHHYTTVIDPSDTRLYIDGVSCGTATYRDPASDNPLGYEFNISSGEGYDWIGEIDEVYIYNKALTAQQIQKHYAESAPKFRMTLK